WEPWLNELIAENRAIRLCAPQQDSVLWVAAERLAELKAIFSSEIVDRADSPPTEGGNFQPTSSEGCRGGSVGPGNPPPTPPKRGISPLSSSEAPLSEDGGSPFSPEQALVEVLRGRLEGLGPVTSQALAASAGLKLDAVEAALIALEAEGFVLRGKFTPGSPEIEWCVRHLLARIHRRTINRLRQE